MRRTAISLLALAAAPFAVAQEGRPEAPPAAQVVVTGSVRGQAVLDAPYAVGVVDGATLRAAGPMVDLAESLARVPGLVVNNRRNLAQDVQVASRGFGARTAFGVRGVRLYADGIPATGPDGQGQVSHFDLADADRVEVLRGPFSALYGNSSGGVIALFSAPVRGERSEAAVDAGSFGFAQVRASHARPLGEAFLRVGASAMHTDGFRPHSAADRRLASLRGGWEGGADRVNVAASLLDQPADDPLGLTRAQFEADPRSTAPQADTFDTRKTTRQGQLGAHWRHRFGAADSALREAALMLYGGRRSVTQWQAIPVATQAAPRHGGGVIDFDRDYGGAEARLGWRVAETDIVTGVAADTQRDDRRGFENFIGTQLGVTGALRREEVNRATSSDVFVQAERELGAHWGVSAGVRSGRVRMRTEDRFLANGDDSGALRYTYSNPVAGLRWRAAPGLTLYASAARGAETPTLNELAYRPDGAGGFNDALRKQTSRQVELGAKWRGAAFDLDAAVFRASADDEIGVATNAGGRSSFRNVGRTLRRGVELGAAWRPAAAWRLALAASWLDASYRDGFLTCTAAPCTTPSVPVAAGNRIAGTQRATGFAEAAWAGGPAVGTWGVEWRGASRTAVDDRNSDFAPGWGTLALRWQNDWRLGTGWRLELLARLENLAGRRYAGSVIVNEANGRYFEPGPPRSALLALRLVGG